MSDRDRGGEVAALLVAALVATAAVPLAGILLLPWVLFAAAVHLVEQWRLGGAIAAAQEAARQRDLIPLTDLRATFGGATRG